MTYTVKQLTIGLSEVSPSLLMINTNNTVDEVLTTGYLGPAFNYSPVTFTNKQLAIVYTTDGGTDTYRVSVDASGITSLVTDLAGLVDLPVVSGNFPKFSGITGLMIDSGISPSNAAKTKAMMANGAMVVDNFITAADIAGTGKDSLKSASDATKTKVVMMNGTAVVGDLAKFSDVNGTITESNITASTVLISGFVNPDVNSNIVTKDITVSAAALAAGASVTLQPLSASKQYKIRELYVNSNGTNFSGGGGDRLLSITDNTTVYSVVPAASLQTLVNTGWGVAGLPFPASAALNTSTTAGAAIVAKYSGGAADYAAGSVVISLVLERVA